MYLASRFELFAFDGMVQMVAPIASARSGGKKIAGIIDLAPEPSSLD